MELQALLKNEQEVLGQLYTAYREPFLQWALKHYACSIEEAKDAYQHSILVFYEKLRQEQLTVLKSSIKTYLFAIGKNHLRERFRYRQKHTSNELVLLQHGEQFDVSMTNDTTDEDSEKIAKMQAILGQLGSKCQQILRLFYYEKKGMEEIAAKLSYSSTGSAKNQKYKCLEQVRKKFFNR